MSLRISLVVPEIVNIVIVTHSVNLHCLQENCEFLLIWLTIYTKYIREYHSASLEVTQTNYEQVNDIFEEIEILPMRLHISNESHGEVLGKLSFRWKVN